MFCSSARRRYRLARLWSDDRWPDHRPHRRTRENPASVSRWTDLNGPVRYLDFGGPPAAPGRLRARARWLGGQLDGGRAAAHRDLPGPGPGPGGTGLTQSLGRGTDVASNRALLHRFVMSVTGAPVILMGNSMGGMISLLEASAAPAAVAGLVLVDPALPFVPARPDPLAAAMFAAYSPPGCARQRRPGAAARPRRAGSPASCGCAARIPRGWHRTCSPGMSRSRRNGPPSRPSRPTSPPRCARSSGPSAIPTGGPTAGGIRSVACPVLLIHGTADRLVPIAAARAAIRANPAWSLREFGGVGHVPQLEAPGDTAAAVLGWLGSAGQQAARAARAARTPGPGPDEDGIRVSHSPVDEAAG